MGFFSKFEGKMEDTLEGAAERMMNSPISPVQIAKKAEKQMRREKMVGAGKQYAPTLYTILVNPDDDQRLFGYYPTLAGETETYLAAKAADEGLVMDGQPLVRFIVDEGLKRGKFDVIAEPVAAPVIVQLRAEEMHRYGLGGAPITPAYQAPDAGYNATPQYNRTSQPLQQPAYNSFGQPAQPQQQPYSQPLAPQPHQNLDAEFNGYGQNEGALDDFGNAAKPPLPYVPENEIDYSIDYGEYTFDSQNFDDYRENGRSQGTPLPQEDFPPARGNAAGAGAGVAVAGAAAAGAAAYAAANAQPGTPMASDTVVFAAGAAQANQVPSQAAVRASLIDTTNNRTYTLAAARFLMGRESKNDIVVNDINASRVHAELRLEPQGVWTITDLGSTNGTLVNGVEVATQPLREGDRITIGMTDYVLTLA